MARATQEQSERTAATVLATARALFAEQGYAAVGLEQVASAAGVTRGAVYHHFAGKEGLFRAVVADLQKDVAEAIGAAAPGDGWRDLEEGSVAFVRAASADGVSRVLLVDGPAVLGWSEWRALDAQNGGVLLDEVLAGLPELAISAGAAAAILNGAMNEAALWVAAGGDADEADRGIRRTIAALRA